MLKIILWSIVNVNGQLSGYKIHTIKKYLNKNLQNDYGIVELVMRPWLLGFNPIHLNK